MPVFDTEKILIGSCDNGYVDSSFFFSLTDLLTIKNYPYELCGNARAGGPLIHKNREAILKNWIVETDADWLLFVDSDISFTPKDLEFLCDSADSQNRKIVSGLYFTLEQRKIVFPYPAAFERGRGEGYLPLQEIEENSLRIIDAAGLGFVLIHRSVIQKILETYSLSEIFVSSEFGEDMAFFEKVREIGEDVYLDTRASVKHMKRYPVDLDFYKMHKSYNLEKMKDN